MRQDSSGTSDLERLIGRAAVEAARMSSQAGQVARRIMGELTSETAEQEGRDVASLDLLDTNEELIALVALPGAEKDSIDLRVTEDHLYVEAGARAREGRFLRREISPLGYRRELALPAEIKPEQVRASFSDGILEVHLPKLVVVNAQRVRVD